MKIAFPEYYKNFKCIADKCPASCCVGWGITVDGETLEKYKELPEGKREEILNTVEHREDGTFFRLDDCDRCPHLDSRGLCKIIYELGEEYLCQTCHKHPRYFNKTAEGIEGGLGLVCAEAAKQLFLSSGISPMVDIDYMDVTPRYTCEDPLSLKVRNFILDYLYSLDISNEGVEVLINRLLKTAELLDDVVFENSFEEEKRDVSYEDLLDPKLAEPYAMFRMRRMMECFEDIETLTEGFDYKVKITSIDIIAYGFANSFLIGEGEKYFLKLLGYFVHRYFLNDETTYLQSMRFAICSALFITATAHIYEDSSLECFVIQALDFSRNVEYCEENMEKILERLGEIE